MKKFLLMLLCTGFSLTTGFSQKTLSDYSYVTVPEKFEFLSKKDDYLLNSLTKFLFNKYGFNAFFEKEIPEQLSRCDGLNATVEKEGGFIYTKLAVILKDCKGNEVYRSSIGKSKIKDFKQAYHQALRRAFKDVERLGINQKEIKKEEVLTIKKNDEINTSETFASGEYTYKEYTLIKNDKRYTVWKNNEIIGEAVPSSKEGYFVIKTTEFIGIGIQNDEYFSVERYEAKKPKLFPMLFKRNNQ